MKKFLFVLAAMLALPAFVFSKGAVIPYVAGWVSQPTDAELNKMTHLMIFQMFPDAQGNLITAGIPSWFNNAVTAAHAKGVKVSVALGGASAQYTPNFVTATNQSNRSRLVNNVKNFVNDRNLDGIDIDWEFPKNDDEWKQCMDLLKDLKTAMPDKRISIAIGGDSPNSQFGNHFIKSNAASKSYIQQNLFQYADAIHIMTYDMMGVTQPVKWNTHSDVEASKRCLQDWNTFGNGQPGYKKEQLMMGCAFYATQGTNGDNASTLKQKVDWTYDNGFGGVIIWELSQDRPTGTLLSAIWNANQTKGGYTGAGGGGVVKRQITVTHNDNGTIKNGSVTVNNGGNVEVDNGGNVTLSFTPNSGYQITDTKVGATSTQNPTAASYSFSNVTSNQTLNVTFSKRHSVPGSFNASEYSKKTAEIVYNDDQYGKYVGNLVKDSKLEYMVSVARAGKYKLSAETAVGDAAKRTLALSSGSTALGEIVVENHTGGWFNFVAREIIFDLAAGNQTFTFISNGAVNVKSIVVSEVLPDKHQITVTHNGYGTVKNGDVTINNGGNTEVNNGANLTLSFTPNSDYEVSDIKVGASSVTVANPYILSNVTQAQNIDVTFSKRWTVPATFNSTQYSKKSSEIRIEEGEHGKSVGYLKNGSTLEYKISVSKAGKYEIGIETAVGENFTRELSVYLAENSLGKISVSGGNDWFNFVERKLVVDLAAGERTFRLLTNGAINIRNISISEEGVTPPLPDDDFVDLADGSWEWEKAMDDEGLGSSIVYDVAEGNISFELKLGVSDEEEERWTWSEIAAYPGGDWSKVTGITITYTSDKPILLTLQDNLKLAESGRGYFVELPAGENKTAPVSMTSFAHFESDWATMTNFSLDQLYILEGVAISPAEEGDMAKGTIKSLKVNGLIVEDEGGGDVWIAASKSKKSLAASAAIMNGCLNLSFPANANNAHIVLFDVRGRILFERNIAVNGNFASVALPKSISRYQVTILQVKTNSGVNMTKRILIK
ncbi:MAG: hypothetical protein LBH98_01010 [Chitinispirillales bacterium]|nr:hypothetical protein [Chitinispirillales bacterium]